MTSSLPQYAFVNIYDDCVVKFPLQDMKWVHVPEIFTVWNIFYQTPVRVAEIFIV